ncbi:MAG: SRPBCC family protein [Candidatus Nanopelagicales bacterium]
MSSDYRFRTIWTVTGSVEELMDVLGDAEALPQWWPAVYLSVTPLREAAPDGTGAAVALHTKGWLPYTLRWVCTITEPMTPEGFALSAQGDLNGAGRWTFTPAGSDVTITYDWHVSASKPLLKRLRWLLKPLFSANHNWAMARGEESLRLELQRRRALRDGELPEGVPMPPGPTFAAFIRHAAVERMAGT